MNEKEILELNKFENEILTLIDEQDQYTRSDLQGIVSVLVRKIRDSK